MVDSISPSSDSGDRSSISPAQIVTIRPQAETMTRQKLPYFVGISGATAGTPGLSMNLVIIPPNGTAAAHYHKDYETAIFRSSSLKAKLRPATAKG